MKVRGPGGPWHPKDLKQKGPNKESQTLEFKKIMEQVSQDKGEISATRPAKPPEPLIGVRMLNSLGPQMKVLLGELRCLIDNMDSYIYRLGDENIKDRDLEPILSHLADRVQSLKDRFGSETMTKGLHDILTELELTVAVEKAKLRRGDYS